MLAAPDVTPQLSIFRLPMLSLSCVTAEGVCAYGRQQLKVSRFSTHISSHPRVSRYSISWHRFSCEAHQDDTNTAQPVQLSVRAVSFPPNIFRRPHDSIDAPPTPCSLFFFPADFEAQPYPRVPRRRLPPRHLHRGRQHTGGESTQTTCKDGCTCGMEQQRRCANKKYG